MASEVNDPWAAYFESIKHVCPWSLSAYRNNRIKFIQGYTPILDLGTHEAIVYFEDFSAKQLERITDSLNDSYVEYEFFWSHPSELGNSAPEGCIIQQDYAKIQQIRQKTGTSAQER